MDLTLAIVTAFSVSLATLMSVMAWRLASEERRRSEARIAALTADIDPPSDPAPNAAADMFAALRPARERSRSAVAATAGIFVVATLAAAVVGFSSHRTPDLRGRSAAQAPLELLALDDEFDAGRLTIRGIVRSPTGATSAAHLIAVVQMFSADGAFVASGRTDVDTTSLEAGREGTFAVTVPGATDVSRYRVSFRSDDRVVPHVDRRESARS